MNTRDKKIIFIGGGLLLIITLICALSFPAAEYYRTSLGKNRSWITDYALSTLSRINQPVERLIFGYNRNPYDEDIRNRVIYQERKPDTELLSNGCNLNECLTLNRQQNELYGITSVRGYYKNAQFTTEQGKTFTCPAFVITGGSEILQKRLHEANGWNSSPLEKSEPDNEIIALQTEDLDEATKKSVEQSSDKNQISLRVFSGSNAVGSSACSPQLSAMKVLAKYETVNFCGKGYMVLPTLLHGVDVVKRIAQIASAHPEDYVCNNIETNTPNGFLDANLQEQSQEDVDYKPGVYYLEMPSHFKIDGNIIYNVGGFDGRLTYYGTLR